MDKLQKIKAEGCIKFNDLKWLITEVERLRRILRLETEKTHICGDCNHWRNYDPLTGSGGECSEKSEICSTFSEHRCDIDAWTARHPKPEPDKLRICNICDHWIDQKWCQHKGFGILEEGVSTTWDFVCDVDCWTLKKSKAELPKLPDVLDNSIKSVLGFDTAMAVNDIIHYLKAKEKEDV